MPDYGRTLNTLAILYLEALGWHFVTVFDVDLSAHRELRHRWTGVRLKLI